MATQTLIIIIVLIVLVVAVLPTWPYSSNWGMGYYPSGALTILVVILLVLLLLGRL